MVEVGSKICFERNKKIQEGKVIKITKKCYIVDIGEDKLLHVKHEKVVVKKTNNLNIIKLNKHILISNNGYECLHLLDKESINMIYIDPPFNSNRVYNLNHESNIGFNDIWKKDTYVIFITDLINIMYNLLKENGTLFFHISSNEMFIPETILRNKFNYVTPIFWKKCRSKNNVKKKLGSTIDIIFKCNKNKNHIFNIVTQEKNAYYLENSYKNKDDVGNYSLGHIVTEKTKKGYMYEISVNDKLYNPKNGWRITKDKLLSLLKENRIHIPKSKGNLYKKIYLHEHPGKPCTDLWDDIHSISQGKEKRLYPTEKPIKLLDRLIKISTNENDIVLDPMCGSGTTGIACSNIGRNCILNDINTDVINIIKNRLL